MAKPAAVPISPSPVADFILLYVLLYGAFGAASPFLPSYIQERGIPPELIGVLVGAGTAVRLMSAPIAGRIAGPMRFGSRSRYVPSPLRWRRRAISRQAPSGRCS
jgi:MFS family permease